jgi:hypothetical protein
MFVSCIVVLHFQLPAKQNPKIPETFLSNSQDESGAGCGCPPHCRKSRDAKWAAVASPPTAVGHLVAACGAANLQNSVRFWMREHALHELRWQHLGLDQCRRELCGQFILIDG